MNSLSAEDIKLINQRGQNIEEIENQFIRFQTGFPNTKLDTAAIVSSGILRLSKDQIELYQTKYEQAKVGVMKFVPASGAASRMFKALYAFLDKYDGTTQSFESISREDKKIGKFFSDLDEFAFYDDLNETLQKSIGISIHEAISSNKHNEIVKHLLSEIGLNYGNLPKGLLKFHKEQGEKKTAAQEHLHEGIAYASKSGKLKIHFTVSPEHLLAFKTHILKSIESLQKDLNTSVTFSTQHAATDTIAVTSDYKPFRDKSKQLLFRPAGHGALLQNLNDLDSDLIFIKNIDNVVPDRLKKETILFKKVLAGVLLSYQEKTFDLLKKNEEGIDIIQDATNLLYEMGIRNFSEKEIANLLNRPIRVCGMVKNEGEPGGGPFWVKSEGKSSLQIVESAQIDMKDVEQKKIFKSGTHFNPVDLVCGVKNHKGEKFDLLKYRDDEAGFISEKSFGGQKLLAMELPGLWNGSMANWNTIFVEVPLITFNPVKTVTDLLKPAHR
ncbi:DUF4301 family protein [Ekhidna sp.]|uniref:DUF4301 family protein n=1 Tax=Ekhidna sp. TaxID=2608089 RepID=UPI003B5118D1